MRKPYQGHIINWQLSHFAGKPVIMGLIQGSKKSEEYLIRTSPVVSLTPNAVETQNSIYSLGEMAKP